MCILCAKLNTMSLDRVYELTQECRRRAYNRWPWGPSVIDPLEDAIITLEKSDIQTVVSAHRDVQNTVIFTTGHFATRFHVSQGEKYRFEKMLQMANRVTEKLETGID